MVKQSLKICHLYPRSMNIYGDTGNIRALEYRLLARSLGCDIIEVDLHEPIPSDVDIIFAGGGQDRGQLEVEKDLQKKAKLLKNMSDDNVVILTICGTYQLFGNRFVTQTKEEIQGIGIFDIETFGSEERLIGNITINTFWGKVVGFENHSGQTFLNSSQQPLGEVIKGEGNNSKTNDEGAIKNNTFGSYLHGPILPKNPHFADELLIRALERKYGDVNLAKIDDEWEKRAFDAAINLPR